MTQAHERRKQPEIVRRALLDCAAKISLDQGLPAVTLQAVADAANVTKGGLLHHFPSKQALLKGVFEDLLQRLDAEIDELMAKDEEPYGRFTRAYIRAFAKTDSGTEGDDGEDPWNALPLSSLTDPEMKAMWSNWYAARLARHAGTDAGATLSLARYTADGIWLAGLLDYAGVETTDRTEMLDKLIALTRKEKT
ncbi:TetR/AcrR family transcriptional regulator [Neorhizobium sp. NCHU2750]|uniref:TetR/AcrR family transcriptional regulator n=1 Tax=Neorhizobium sp. NCHU2750 TaxID=1825976 RepID=UPI000E714F06|nr:TetR family transcriptional regulator [Neorhizobium sp. NCHU2750]